MAEENTVTRTVENVDRLFSEIIVNGESHVSERYVAPEPETAPAVTPEPEVSEPSSDTPSQQTVQGQDVYAVELNAVLHNFVDRAVTQGLANEVSARENADNTLQGNITMEATARQNADNTLQGNIDALVRRVTTNEGDIVLVKADISDIEALIPNQASDQNQLADKAFVNSSVATNTANYISNNGLPFDSVAELEAYSGTVTNNDYAFVTGTDSAGNTYYDRYKATVVGSTVTWALEYRLNNSSFTAEQWATINSGLTQNSVNTSIENAINALDVSSAGGSGKYISAIEQVDGKILATEGTIDSAPTSGSDNPVSSDGVYQALQNAGGSVKYITTASTTSPVVITNAPSISTGDIVKIWFTANILVANNTTGLVISYNGISIPVMLNYSGTLSAFLAKKYFNANQYQYFQQNTVIDFLYDGTNFIVQGLPVCQNPTSTTGIMTMSDGITYPTAGYMNNQLATKLGKEQFSIGQGQSYSFTMAEGTCALIAYTVRNYNGDGGLTFVTYDNSYYSGRVNNIVTPSMAININLFSGIVTISNPYALPVVGSIIRL